MKKLKIKRFFILFLILVIDILLLVFFINNIFNSTNNKNKLEIKGDVFYKVNILNNPYIKEDFLLSDRSYLAILTKNINISFSYSLKTEKNNQINSNYNIKSYLIGINDQNAEGELYKEENILLKDTNIKGENIKINQELTINLEEYTNKIRNFKEAFNITLNSFIKIELNVLNVINNQKFVHKEWIEIPIDKNIYKINTSKNYNENENIITQNDKNIYFNLIIIIILFILINYYAYTLIYRKIRQSNFSYEEKKNKILKDYDERIINVYSFVNEQKYDVIKLKSFKELINLSDEALEPIIFFEETKNRKKFQYLPS